MCVRARVCVYTHTVIYINTICSVFMFPVSTHRCVCEAEHLILGNQFKLLHPFLQSSMELCFCTHRDQEENFFFSQ